MQTRRLIERPSVRNRQNTQSINVPGGYQIKPVGMAFACFSLLVYHTYACNHSQCFARELLSFRHYFASYQSKQLWINPIMVRDFAAKPGLDLEWDAANSTDVGAHACFAYVPSHAYTHYDTHCCCTRIISTVVACKPLFA